MKNTKWLKTETDFLIENYPSNGALFCIEKLQKTKQSVLKKINRLGLKRLKDKKYSYEYLKDVVEKSINYLDVCRNLGLSTYCGNRQTVKKYIEEYKLNVEHFYTPSNGGGKPKRIEEILIKNSNFSSRGVKDKILKYKLIKYKCECGNIGLWLGKPISLQLDHKNGDNKDNRIENLRFLCPNCHSQTETFGSKNIKR